MKHAYNLENLYSKFLANLIYHVLLAYYIQKFSRNSGLAIALVVL